jgi:hypothetical protein
MASELEDDEVASKLEDCEFMEDEGMLLLEDMPLLEAGLSLQASSPKKASPNRARRIKTLVIKLLCHPNHTAIYINAGQS